MLDRIDDTIVAVSSAPGYGLLGIVRLSGPEAIRIADRMVRTDADMPFATLLGSTRASRFGPSAVTATFMGTSPLVRAPRAR